MDYCTFKETSHLSVPYHALNQQLPNKTRQEQEQDPIFQVSFLSQLSNTMPFLIGETQWLLSIEDEKVEANNSTATITFTITATSIHHRKLMREPDVPVGSLAVPITTLNLEVDKQDFLACNTSEEAYSRISDLVASLDINPCDKQNIGYNLVKQARILARLNSSSGTKLMLNVDMKLVTTYWWQGTDPASQSSIANLEQGSLEDFAGEIEKSCSICLEEFQAPTKIKRMPCLHIFHSHCIDQWLNKNHYCPLCRFEMPASCLNYEAWTV